MLTMRKGASLPNRQNKMLPSWRYGILKAESSIRALLSKKFNSLNAIEVFVFGKKFFYKKKSFSYSKSRVNLL